MSCLDADINWRIAQCYGIRHPAAQFLSCNKSGEVLNARMDGTSDKQHVRFHGCISASKTRTASLCYRRPIDATVVCLQHVTRLQACQMSFWIGKHQPFSPQQAAGLAISRNIWKLTKTGAKRKPDRATGMSLAQVRANRAIASGHRYAIRHSLQRCDRHYGLKQDSQNITREVALDVKPLFLRACGAVALCHGAREQSQ
jgi:hypothetical protein